jgi:hypothetical protein
LFIHHRGHHLLESRGEGDNAIEYVHLIPSPTTHSSRSPFVHFLLKRDFSAWCLCLLSTMIADDDASVASKDMIDRQNQWRKKKKEEAKQSAQNQLRDWMSMVTIDDIILSADGTTITEIDTKPTDKYNMLYLRALCSKLKINGYKNKRRDETIRLLLEKKRVKLVESAHYAVEGTENLTVGALTECILSDVSSPGVTILPRSPETRSMTQSRLTLTEATAAEAVSSPETRCGVGG